MTTPKYPRIEDAKFDDHVAGRLHCEIDVTWTEGTTPQRFCGDNWRSGDCGLPALMLRGQPLRKLSGSQVAMGQAFQQLRVTWKGKRKFVPSRHCEDFAKRWYI